MIKTIFHEYFFSFYSYTKKKERKEIEIENTKTYRNYTRWESKMGTRTSNEEKKMVIKKGLFPGVQGFKKSERIWNI